MNRTQSTKRNIMVAAVLAACIAPLGTALAAPPEGTPYHTDGQTSFVEDATSQGIGTVNMIMCFIKAMALDQLVNQGAYAALIDGKKCNDDRSSVSNESAAAGAATPSYNAATIVSTRESNTAPMTGKAWLTLNNEHNGPLPLIHLGMTASEAPSSTAPYGVFRLDFCGVVTGSSACLMRGTLKAQSTGLSFYETDSNENGGSDTTQLVLTRQSGTDAGAGRLAFVQPDSSAGAFYFAYNASHYLRGNANNTSVCFSREEAQAQSSVWRYGLYNEAGLPVPLNSGFPVLWTDPTTNRAYQGNIGYYGLWLPEGKDADVQSGNTVTRQQFAANAVAETYRIAKAGGRLTRHVKRTATLDTLVNVKLNVGFMSQPSGGNPSFVNQEMIWNGTQFLKTGRQICTTGCTIVALPTPEPIDNASWANVRGGLFGHSQTLNGEIRIAEAELAKVAASAAGSTISLTYRSQALVYPTQMPTTLYCLGECTDAAAMATYFANPNAIGSTLFITGTAGRQFQNGGVPMAELITYSADASTGLLSRQGSSAPMLWNSAWMNNAGNYQSGVRSGKLFATASDVACDADSTKACGNKVEDLPEYFVWETGPQSWNQFVALTTTDGSNCTNSTDKYCRFDAPMQLNYTVPNEASYGEFRGQAVVLQYGGFGNLWGVPGFCVNRNTNEPANCNQGGSNIRYVPAFTIPFESGKNVLTRSTSTGTETYYAKWLDRELRFRKLDVSACSALTLPTNLALPDGTDFQNPGPAGGLTYLGAQPTVTGAPRVIHGEVKY